VEEAAAEEEAAAAEAGAGGEGYIVDRSGKGRRRGASSTTEHARVSLDSSRARRRGSTIIAIKRGIVTQT
jgi:hypothetical protein